MSMLVNVLVKAKNIQSCRQVAIPREWTASVQIARVARHGVNDIQEPTGGKLHKETLSIKNG